MYAKLTGKRTKIKNVPVKFTLRVRPLSAIEVNDVIIFRRVSRPARSPFHWSR